MTFLSSKDNPLIKDTVKLKKSAKHRKKTGMFIAEGLRVCMDAMYSKADIQTLFVTKTAADKNEAEFLLLRDYCKKVCMVTPEIFAYISDTQTPQGFLCIVKTLDKSCQFDTIKGNGKMIALDNMQDPNNLGTVLRSAEAFGVSGVILSNDCCDIYNPKVVRGSMGAVFRVPFLVCGTVAEFLGEYPELVSYAAVVDSNAERITDISFGDSCVAVIGNEGNGLKQETVSACQHKITIPMNGNAESLNASAAATVIIWEMLR